MVKRKAVSNFDGLERLHGSMRLVRLLVVLGRMGFDDTVRRSCPRSSHTLYPIPKSVSSEGLIVKTLDCMGLPSLATP